ncbi:hypothetical protein ACTFIZ_007705 [Dictyostelium cf. discoideum]
MSLSYIMEAAPHIFIGEPMKRKKTFPTCIYHIIYRNRLSEILEERPIIFSPIINQLKILPLDLNDIPMSVSIPELFTDPYLHVFKSFPLYKTVYFIQSIGLF